MVLCAAYRLLRQSRRPLPEAALLHKLKLFRAGRAIQRGRFIHREDCATHTCMRPGRRTESKELNTHTSKDTPWRVLVSSGIRVSAVWISSPRSHPLWMRRGAQGQTDQGKNLFERSKLFLTPAGPSTAGCPVAKRRGRSNQGRLFFACRDETRPAEPKPPQHPIQPKASCSGTRAPGRY